MSMHVHVILLCSLLLLLCFSLASAPASLAVVAYARSTPHACCTQFRWYWRPLACAEVHQFLPRKFVVGHGLVTGSHAEAGYQRWGFRSGRRFSSCFRGGGRVNFRPAGGVRGQVAGSLPGRQPGTGTRQVRGGAVTPSLHPEVPGIRFVSPGYGLDIRQSMGWTTVCGTAQSGIWVLKGNVRTCMFLANLDHLRVERMKRGTYKTAWVTPGHDCLCSCKYGHGAAVRPQKNNAIWDGVIGLWGRVAPFLSPWCGKKDVPTGVNLNQYAGSGSFIRWHSDNEPLFGPQNFA